MPSEDSSKGHDKKLSAANFADLPNPYEFAHPVTDFAYFAGRSAELEDIRYYLGQAKYVAQPVNLAIIGERASGKTSLLNMIDIEGQKAGLLTARINLNSGDADPINLFWKLYDAVVETVTRAGYLFQPGSDDDVTYRRIIDGLDPTADKPGFPLRFPAHYATSVNGSRRISEPRLQQDLTYIASQTHRTLVLLFDECNVLTQNRIALEMLRNVFMDTPGYLLVLTGTQSFFPLLDDVFSPIIRQYKRISIAPFSSRQETQACIDKPLVAIGANAQEILQPYYRIGFDVHAISGGRPYEIQLLCHFMFRRVQEDRAQYMELTADVIDDVLRELDTSINQEAVERPIISAARKLTNPQLRALDALGQCTATFDQTCFLYALRSDASSDGPAIPREALLLALDNFVSLGILKVIDDKISFAGDEFDRTYIRYHAERAGVSVNPGTSPFSFTFGVTLNRAIDLRGGEEAFVDWGSDEVSAPVLESMTSLLDPESGAVTESISLVINHVIDALPCGQLLLLKVTAIYDGTSAFTWLAFKEEDYVKFIETGNLAELSQKIEENNGALTVEEFRFPLPPEDWIIDRILSSGNNRLAREIGEGYLGSAGMEYFRGRRESALSKVEHGLRFPLPAIAVSDAGYIKLASGEYKSADELFARAVGLALADDEYRQAAIAMYNRGAALVMLGDRPGALKQWEEARKLTDQSQEAIELTCLFVPKISSGNLIMSEVKNPELSATIEEAVNTLTNLTADVTVPELEFNNDLGTDLDLD